MKELAKQYDPGVVEDRIYRFWLDGEYFHAVPDKTKRPYSIVIPPPNITGQLHMGHALDNTLQDALIRFKRMQGYSALWLPGTDHASIATEAKIVEQMRSEGITKDDLGRDGFLERAWKWKEKYGGRIVSQLKKMGSSCDWERERFTLDEGCSKAVREVFIHLYEKGLIYRGERIVNWCPHCLTSISDAEVEYEDQAGHFWHLRYPLADGSGEIRLATTRPETLLGDTAVAVNPKDERYRDLVGKMVVLPLCNREIPIVADDYVEMDFGTGAVKITPAHDPNDFEVGRRHDLPVINMLTSDAKIEEGFGKYSGLDRYEARKLIVEDLKEQGYLLEVEDYAHNVGTCYRCKTTIEPRVSLQWFVSMKELAAPAIEAVRDGSIKFVPKRFEKNYFYWMENIRDWCISRQLWWGHRIPAFYCDDCGETVVTLDENLVCPKCGGHMTQDPDTLDTWFSSALWPFSTLGWPERTEDLDYFYPTSTLVTGYDIITFWVSRMIFSGLEYTGKKPFDTVLIHGLVRDAQGRKMSKSLGNGIDPLEIIDKYGADALRFTLATGNSPGNDMRFSDEKVLASRNFTNKLWNSARFVLMNIADDDISLTLPEKLTTEDKWIITKQNRLISEVTANFDSFELGVAVSKLYDFTWDVFCDWYIELVKTRLWGEDKNDALRVLVFVFARLLQLLHPFMPFITEEIWQALPHEGESIMVSRWPQADDVESYDKEADDFEKIVEAIGAIRVRRSEMNVPPSKKTHVYVETQYAEIFKESQTFFERLAYSSNLTVSSEAVSIPDCVTVVTDGAKIFIPTGELIDFEKELERLTKERDMIKKDVDFITVKLSNQGFVAKAPAKVVEGERDKLARAQEKLSAVEESIARLSK